MQASNVTHKVIETVTCHTMSRVEIETTKSCHDVSMIRHFEVGNNRLAKTFFFHVERVVLPYRHLGSDDIRNGIHHLSQLFHERGLLLAELFQFLGVGFHEFLHLIGFLDFLVLEKDTDFLRDGVTL